MGGEKRAWYTLFAHAQFPQDFWEFGNFRKIRSVTLTSARVCRLLPYERCLSLTTLCVDMTKEQRKYSALRLQELSKRVCSLSSFIDRDGGAELVWGWRRWVQVEPKAHRAAAVSPFSRVIDRSFGVALLATI